MKIFVHSHVCLLLQMLTTSKERFESIKKEAPPEFKNNLIQVTKYQAGQDCKVSDSLRLHCNTLAL